MPLSRFVYAQRPLAMTIGRSSIYTKGRPGGSPLHIVLYISGREWSDPFSRPGIQSLVSNSAPQRFRHPLQSLGRFGCHSLDLRFLSQLFYCEQGVGVNE